jgi:hypothetical protein
MEIQWKRGTRASYLLADDRIMAAATDNVLNYIERATPAQRITGIAWYPTHRALIAAAGERHGLSAEQSIALFALCSMSANLPTNWRSFETVARTRDTRGTYLTRWQRAIAAAILAQSHQALQLVSGPKLLPFAVALYGDPQAVVVDRWMLRIVLGRTRGQPERPTDVERAICIAALRIAAAQLGMNVRDLQALAWVVAVEQNGGLSALLA